MRSLKDVVIILSEKLESDKHNMSYHDGSDDLYFVLAHRLQQAFIDAATNCHSKDDYVKTLMISSHAADLFLNGLIELPSKL